MIVYVLCEDTDGTLRSRPWPTGKAVRDPITAERWKKQAEPGYDRAYVAVTIVDDPDSPPTPNQE